MSKKECKCFLVSSHNALFDDWKEKTHYTERMQRIIQRYAKTKQREGKDYELLFIGGASRYDGYGNGKFPNFVKTRYGSRELDTAVKAKPHLHGILICCPGSTMQLGLSEKLKKSFGVDFNFKPLSTEDAVRNNARYFLSQCENHRTAVVATDDFLNTYCGWFINLVEDTNREIGGPIQAFRQFKGRIFTNDNAALFSSNNENKGCNFHNGTRPWLMKSRIKPFEVKTKSHNDFGINDVEVKTENTQKPVGIDAFPPSANAFSEPFGGYESFDFGPFSDENMDFFETRLHLSRKSDTDSTISQPNEKPCYPISNNLYVNVMDNTRQTAKG